MENVDFFSEYGLVGNGAWFTIDYLCSGRVFMENSVAGTIG